MKDESKKKVANYLHQALHRQRVHHHHHHLQPTLPTHRANENLNENVKTKKL